MKSLKYSKAPTVIFRLPIGSQLKRMLLFVLASMENTGTKPTQGLLAYEINSSQATVSKLLNELQAEGWVNIVHPKGMNQTNLYNINWGKIKGYATTNDYFTPTVVQEEDKTLCEQERCTGVYIVYGDRTAKERPLPNYPTYEEKQRWGTMGYTNDYILRNWKKIRASEIN